MKYEVYKNLKVKNDFQVFDFESSGKLGIVRKRVAFQTTNIPNIYNLAFGDVTPNDEIDDLSISNNGDRNKVLATVARIVEIYLAKFPHRYVYIQGSTKERTRLYRMAIGLNLEELSKKFLIYAELHNGDLAPFYNNMNINAFLIRRKKS